jgi:beta-glucosidase/6-phospho-beta-glucosidase/beta-galactosidase
MFRMRAQLLLACICCLLLAFASTAAQAASCKDHGLCANTVPVPEACSLALRQKIAWGVSTAAYQIEGGWSEGGRSPSVWDVWSQTPGRVYKDQNGDVACDHYHRWREDIELMQQLGLKHYRLSLSWTRIIPGGFKGSPVNPEGIKFYKQLLQGLR